MATTDQITTAEQLLQASDLGRCELVRGELIMMSPGGYRHAHVISRVSRRLADFVDRHALGEITWGELGFKIAENPDSVRAPDIGFIRSERVPATLFPGFYPGAPDLAVEVLSPTDRASEVLAKVQDWLEAGCRAVWLIDPERRTVSVYRDRNEIVVLRAEDVLSGDDLLPGFSMPLADIFGK
jgi:Uma2 family endonuclease